MKNIVIGLGVLTITILMVFTLVTLNINTTQQNKTENSTKIAVYQTLKECKKVETWSVIQALYDSVNVDTTYKKEDMILAKRFKENLAGIMKASKNQVISFKIIESNWQDGILSVEVTNKYQNLGLKKTVKVRKTVIYETTN